MNLPTRWDTDTAAAALVIASLVFLYSVRKGFRGILGG